MFRRKDENDPTGGEESTSSSASASPASGADSASPPTSYGSASPASGGLRPVTPDAPKAPLSPSPSAYRPTVTPPGMAPRGTPSPVGADKSSGKANRRILTVGHDILLKGEIATCDRLVIEGQVDASLKDVHTVEIAETGSFKGAAQIEDAEISGLFEGELVVRNRLIIYSTGKVRGKITYGEIEIERGGEMTGEIKTTTSAKAGEKSSSASEKKSGQQSFAA